MLWVWENTLVTQRPVLNVIITLYTFSRNGFTSSRSYRDVVWCTLHSVLAEMELHKSALIEWARTPSIPIIHLGDKTILAAESKAVSKVLLRARVLCYGNSLRFLLCIWKGKLQERTATVDITVRKNAENTKGRTSCQPEISTNTHPNRNKFNPTPALHLKGHHH